LIDANGNDSLSGQEERGVSGAAGTSRRHPVAPLVRPMSAFGLSSVARVVQGSQRPPLESARMAQLAVNARLRLRRCSRIGHMTMVRGRPWIRNGGSITIGERVLVWSHLVPVELTAINGGSIEIGDRTFVNYGVIITSYEQVTIGSDCRLAHHVIIMDCNEHPVLGKSQHPRPVVLENNVWLGDRTLVLPGVRIGKGAVVGAGSVVAKDIPPGCVAVGNPARVVKAPDPEAPSRRVVRLGPK
jgi:acetyltransferase-like isoleucine patch superfamily enzyme